MAPSEVQLRKRWILIALIVVSFAIRVYRLQFQSLWRDEVDAVLFATRDWPALFHTFTAPGENGPLYFLMMRPWIALLGTSEFAVRYSSVAFGVLAVLLVYQLGRKMLPTEVSFLGAMLVAFSPYLVWYSQEAKMYALLVCLSALAAWYLLGALQQGDRANWVGYTLTTSLSFYIHILAVVLLPFHVLLFIAGGRRFWAHWRGALVSLACLTLPYLPLVRWEIPTLLSSFKTGHPFYSLDEIFRILFQAFSFGIKIPTVPEISLVLFLLLAGTFLYRQPGLPTLSLQSRPQGTLWLYALAPVLTVYLISLGMPIFTDRYLITVAPAFYLLLASGLWALRTRSRVLFGLCLLGLLLMDGQGLWSQSHTVIKADFRGVSACYAAHASADDLLIFQMPYVRRNFEYYFHVPYHGANGLYTNNGMKPTRADARMTALTAGYTTVWLLKSEAATWDERGLVEGWLSAHGSLTDRADFTLVSLCRYTLSP